MFYINKIEIEFLGLNNDNNKTKACMSGVPDTRMPRLYSFGSYTWVNTQS